MIADGLDVLDHVLDGVALRVFELLRLPRAAFVDEDHAVRARQRQQVRQEVVVRGARAAVDDQQRLSACPAPRSRSARRWRRRSPTSIGNTDAEAEGGAGRSAAAGSAGFCAQLAAAIRAAAIITRRIGSPFYFGVGSCAVGYFGEPSGRTASSRSASHTDISPGPRLAHA